MLGKLAVGIALVVLGSQAVVNGAKTIGVGLWYVGKPYRLDNCCFRYVFARTCHLFDCGKKG